MMRLVAEEGLILKAKREMGVMMYIEEMNYNGIEQFSFQYIHCKEIEGISYNPQLPQSTANLI